MILNAAKEQTPADHEHESSHWGDWSKPFNARQRQRVKTAAKTKDADDKANRRDEKYFCAFCPKLSRSKMAQNATAKVWMN